MGDYGRETAKKLLDVIRKGEVSQPAPLAPAGGMEAGDKLQLEAIGAIEVEKQRPGSEKARKRGEQLQRGEMKEDKVFNGLCSEAISAREEALASLSSTSSRDLKVSLCSVRIMDVIVPMLESCHPLIENALLFVQILSEEKSNRATIGQHPGVISNLVRSIGNSVSESYEAALMALWHLASEQNNKEIIGSTAGAISGLLDLYFDSTGNHVGRTTAGMTLDLICFASDKNVMRLLERRAVVQKLLSLAVDTSSEHAKNFGVCAMGIIRGLSLTTKGRIALIQAEAVREIVRVLKSEERNALLDFSCFVALSNICQHDEASFRSMAVAVGAETILSQDQVSWGDYGREAAKKLLDVIRKGEVSQPSPLATVGGMEARDELPLESTGAIEIAKQRLGDGQVKSGRAGEGEEQLQRGELKEEKEKLMSPLETSKEKKRKRDNK